MLCSAVEGACWERNSNFESSPWGASSCCCCGWNCLGPCENTGGTPVLGWTLVDFARDNLFLVLVLNSIFLHPKQSDSLRSLRPQACGRRHSTLSAPSWCPSSRGSSVHRHRHRHRVGWRATARWATRRRVRARKAAASPRA